MKAMILAAGFGTRLGNLTIDTPKILIDINGKSVLEHILRKLKSHGFDEFIINVHFQADMIEGEAEKLSKLLELKIHISDERKALLDTGGGIFKAKSFFSDEPFLLYNGDILTDMNIKALYDFHVQKNATATIATKKRQGNRLFLIDKDGRIRGWTNKLTGLDIVTIDEAIVLNEIASTAISVFSPKIFDYMCEGAYSITSIILEMAGKELVNTYEHKGGYWFDMGSPEQLDKVRQFLLR